jgi:methionyl-tRNA formyltransferase
MGTPGFAVPALHAVAKACDVVAVVTQPDRERGRGLERSESPVAEAARALALAVAKPERVNGEESLETLAALAPDLFAVVAFGAILAPALLRVPRLGSINLHGSLLPDYRGAAPVQRALMDGRCGTGVTTLWMDEGVDTGDMILQRWMAIEPADNAGTLAARLAEFGAPLLADSLTLAHAGRAPRLPQDRAAGSYAKKLAKRDGAVNWERAADQVWHAQRAVTPWPGAFTEMRGRRVVVVTSRPYHRLVTGAQPGDVIEIGAAGVVVACAPGALELLKVKPEGKAEMDAAAWARGARIEVGGRFTWQKEAHA